MQHCKNYLGVLNSFSITPRVDFQRGFSLLKKAKSPYDHSRNIYYAGSVY